MTLERARVRPSRGIRRTAVRGFVVAGLALLVAVPVFAQAAGPDYGNFGLFGLDRRGAVWIAAELHLMFAAFVLGVPMFAVVIEAMGIFGKQDRAIKP